MINLKAAGATQLVNGGDTSDWVISLEGEELYTLPSTFTVQETLLVRRVAEDLIERAHAEGMEAMAKIKDAEIAQVLQIGNNQLATLIVDNTELSMALERHAINNQIDY